MDLHITLKTFTGDGATLEEAIAAATDAAARYLKEHGRMDAEGHPVHTITTHAVYMPDAFIRLDPDWRYVIHILGRAFDDAP